MNDTDEQEEAPPRIIIYPLFCESFEEVQQLCDTLADKLAEIHGPMEDPEENVKSIIVAENYPLGDMDFGEWIREHHAKNSLSWLFILPGGEEL